MTLEEIQEAFPIGCRIQRTDARYFAIITGHCRYNSSGHHSGKYYAVYDIEGGCQGSSWPEYMALREPLTPLELDLKRYIDEEMKQLVG